MHGSGRLHEHPGSACRVAYPGALTCSAGRGQRRHELHVTDWVADFASPRNPVSRYLRNFTYRQRCDGRIWVHGIRLSPALFLPALRRQHCPLQPHCAAYHRPLPDR
jgi:hypothetical protein